MRLHRGSPLTTLQSTKRQPVTTGAVEWRRRVTTSSQTTTRAAPGCPPMSPHMHDDNALRQITMHISANDLHCCTPALLLQLVPSGGRPRSRQSSIQCTPTQCPTSSRTTDHNGRPVDCHQQEPPEFQRTVCGGHTPPQRIAGIPALFLSASSNSIPPYLRTTESREMMLFIGT